MTCHVAIAFDQNYLQPFYALVASLFHSSRMMTHVHVIATGITNEQRSKIEDYIASSGGSITFYNITDPNVTQLVTMSTWTTSVYYRLYFPLLLPSGIERFLYLDTDTLVTDDLRDLLTIDMKDYPVAAVYDNYVKTQPLLGIVQEGEYFNSGVLLIDVKRWRDQKISERTIEYLMQFPERIRFVDQCGLNAVLQNNWLRLTPRFNLIFTYIPEGFGKRQLVQLLKETTIIHFTIERPWRMLCRNRFRDLYKYFLSKSPWRDGPSVTDFSVTNIPEYLRIRLTEFYHDHEVIQRSWRFLKTRFAV